MMKRTAACFAAMMFVMMAALLTAHPVMATDAEDATFEIKAGAPAAEPDVVGPDEATIIKFQATVGKKDAQSQKDPAKKVDSEGYSISAGGDSTITSVSGGDFKISEDKHSASLSHEGAGTVGEVSVTVSFAAAGEKTVSLSGGVTFQDKSSFSDSADVKVTVEDVVWDVYSPIGEEWVTDPAVQTTTPPAPATTAEPAVPAPVVAADGQ